MNSAARAYGQTAIMAASPREGEARALLNAAGKLQSVRSLSTAGHRELEVALMFNRNLWVEIVSRIVEVDNTLPKNIKEAVLSLGQFVFKETLSYQAEPDDRKISSLIQINQDIAMGLQGL